MLGLYIDPDRLDTEHQIADEMCRYLYKDMGWIEVFGRPVPETTH